MQSQRFLLQSILNSKSKLLAIISVVVVAILLAPVVFPNITHPSKIYHNLVHIVSIIIAIFLSVISLLAYFRTLGTRMLFMMLGFVTMAAIEVVYLYDISQNMVDISIPTVDIQLSHIVLFTMLTLFCLGVFKIDKQELR